MAVHDGSEAEAVKPPPEGSPSLERALATALELLAEKEREMAEARRSEERYRSLVEKVMDVQMRTINQVGQQIAAVLDLDELLPFIADLVRKSFGYSNVNLFLRDGSGTRMVLAATSTSYQWPLPLETALRIGEQGIVGWVARSGESMLVNDVSREPRYLSTRELQLTRSELTVPVRLGDQIAGVLDIESDRLNAFDDGDLWVAHTLADQVAVALRNAELFEAERKRRQETALILEITRAVNSTLLLDEVLQVAVDGITRAVGVDDCGMYLVDETNTKLLPRESSDSPLRHLLGDIYTATTLDIPSSRFLSEVMQTRRPTLCANAETDPRISREIAEKFHIKSLLAVPVATRDRVLGMAMVTTYQDFYDFRPEQVELAAGIANSVALAIENARLYERTRELAVMEERNRLAREIHDTIAQGLTGIILQLEAADHLMDANLERARMRVQKATALARSSLQEARRSVWNLRPTPLEERTLIEAVRQEADRLAEETGVQVAFHLEGESVGLSGEMENGLYRMAQEALNNVHKHAQASHVNVRLGFRQDMVEMQIQDDGVGFDPSALGSGGKESGFGLLGILERARLLGGSLQVESSPGQGTAIRVQVPVRH